MMQKRTDVRRTSEVPLEKGWTVCQVCGVKLKGKNLERHSETVHSKNAIESREGIKGRSYVLLFVVIGVIILLISLSAIQYFHSRKGEDDGDDDGQDGDGSDWLANYSPKNNVGISDNDWWTNYPGQNPDWGEAPAHPSWITQYLQNGPVLVLTHSEGCAPCIQQGEDVNLIMKEYGGDIQFLDILSGSDERSNEMFEIYDPNGSPNYIPLTYIATLVEDMSGNIRVGWHSIEGATGEEWLVDHVRDAIYYHRKNIDGWGE